MRFITGMSVALRAGMTPSSRCAVVSVLTALSMATACGAGGPPFRAGLPREPSPSTTCPFGFSGARVAIQDTADGVEITVIGYEQLAELQRRARDAAAMYGPGAHRGLGHHGQHGNGQHHGLGLGQLPMRVAASEEDSSDGAIIRVSAMNPIECASMQRLLHRRADRAREGRCP